MHKDLLVRISWYAASLLLALSLLVRLSVLIATPDSQLRELVDFIYDDGYYYLSIAANIAEFGRSTFDGITATNGYQPLWLLLLAGWAKLIGTRPSTFFFASCALIYALAASTPLLALYWWRSTRRYIALCIAAGVAVIVIMQPAVFLEGLEPLLIAPLVIPLVMLIERDDTNSLLPLSALLALAFLVRLDALALYVASIICLPLFELLVGRLRLQAVPARAFKVALGLSVFVVPTVVAYLAINQWLFGTPVPVSGLAKLIGGPTFGNWGVIAMFFSRARSLAVLVAILVPLEVLTRWLACRPETIFYRSLLSVSVALGLQCFYYAAFSAWNVWPWYAYLLAVAMALLVGRILYLAALLYAQPRARGARMVGIAAALFIGVLAFNRGVAFAYESLPVQAQHKLPLLDELWNKHATAGTVSFNQVSLQMLDEFFNDRPHATIAMGDRAGGLSFWGRGKISIVQTEGLTLDVGYLKARAANAGAAYLERFPLDYLVVDREVIATVTADSGQVQLVVAEPIQGRITTAAVPTFCFPTTAIRYKKAYPSTSGINTRIAFAFAERAPCSEQALAFMRSIEQGIGLRQYSVPSEYDPAVGGTMNKRREDRDRHYQSKD